MPLIINVSDDETMFLAAKARARGLSAEEYAHQLLKEDLALEWL